MPLLNKKCRIIKKIYIYIIEKKYSELKEETLLLLGENA